MRSIGCPGNSALAILRGLTVSRKAPVLTQWTADDPNPKISGKAAVARLLAEYLLPGGFLGFWESVSKYGFYTARGFVGASRRRSQVCRLGRLGQTCESFQIGGVELNEIR